MSVALHILSDNADISLYFSLFSESPQFAPDSLPASEHIGQQVLPAVPGQQELQQE